MPWKNAALFSLGETRFYNVVFKIPLRRRHGRKPALKKRSRPFTPITSRALMPSTNSSKPRA
jgi:hypothetical protein